MAYDSGHLKGSKVWVRWTAEALLLKFLADRKGRGRLAWPDTRHRVWFMQKQTESDDQIGRLMRAAQRAMESVLERDLTTDEYCQKSCSVYFMAGSDELKVGHLSRRAGGCLWDSENLQRADLEEHTETLADFTVPISSA